MTRQIVIAMAASLILVAGPLLVGLAGWFRARSGSADACPGVPTPWSGKLTAMSALLYALAFNLTFFIQELFLVLPKALTPGLRVTLFHNDHHWEGDDVRAHLFQGTGALAIFLSGAVCALLLERLRGRSTAVRLFVFWMAYSGLFMALPQVVIGAVSPRSDLGMAMAYLDLGPTSRTIAALLALAAIPPIAVRLGRPVLDLAADLGVVADARARTVFIFRAVALPSLIAVPLIVAFRVPRDWVEVLVVPVIVTATGIGWIQALAWRDHPVTLARRSTVGSLAWPAAALVLLLLVFQVLLRPGIRFS